MNLPKTIYDYLGIALCQRSETYWAPGGAYLPADIYVRYLRAQKSDVVFVCGSDEHGAAITIQAMKESTTPKAIVDKYHEIIKQNF